MLSGCCIGQCRIEVGLRFEMIWHCFCRGLDEASYFLWMVWEVSHLVYMLILYISNFPCVKNLGGEGLVKYLFFKAVLLSNDSHTILFTHLKSTVQWFLVYSRVHATITGVVDNFSSPQKETLYRLTTNRLSCSQPWAPTNLPSVSVDLPVLDISYKWDPLFCGLCCLAAFPQHSILTVHSRCMRQYSIPFYAWSSLPLYGHATF